MTIRHDWKPAFLKSLSECPVIKGACTAAQVDRSTITRARNKSKAFAQAMDEAIENGVDRAEQEAFRRAVVGHDEPVVDKQGNIVYRREMFLDAKGKEKYRLVLDTDGNPVPHTVKRHSDSLLAMVLKARRKDIYSERTEITGADGGELTISDPVTRSARVAQLMALAAERMARRAGQPETTEPPMNKDDE